MLDSFATLRAMPKRDIEESILHWKGATAPEQSISQLAREIAEIARLSGISKQKAFEESLRLGLPKFQTKFPATKKNEI